MTPAAGSTEVPACSGAAAGEGGAVVVVGVKLDPRSKELLTWALVKVANAGDRVVALYVLDPSAGECSLTLSITQALCICVSSLGDFGVEFCVCLALPCE